MGIGLAVAPRDGETAGDLAGRLLAALDAGQAAGGDSRGKQSGALLVGSIGLGPNILMIAERFMSILREAGFSLEVAAYGWDTIASFITGFVLQEQSAVQSHHDHRDLPCVVYA